VRLRDPEETRVSCWDAAEERGKRRKRTLLGGRRPRGRPALAMLRATGSEKRKTTEGNLEVDLISLNTHLLISK